VPICAASGACRSVIRCCRYVLSFGAVTPPRVVPLGFLHGASD
jgi:hypothetical protein